jgi:hypothetical protein
MTGSLAADEILPAYFGDALSRYQNHVPPKLAELDDLRFNTIPSSLESRRVNGKAWLEKEELQNLVDWKLYSKP